MWLEKFIGSLGVLYVMLNSSHLFIYLFIYLFIHLLSHPRTFLFITFGERGRERMKHWCKMRNIDWLPHVHTRTGDRTCNLVDVLTRNWTLNLLVMTWLPTNWVTQAKAIICIYTRDSNTPPKHLKLGGNTLKVYENKNLTRREAKISVLKQHQ